MNIFPTPKWSSKEKKKIKVINIKNIDVNILNEFNKRLKKNIFILDNKNGIKFLKNKDQKGYSWNLEENKVYYNSYSDKINAIVSLSQYFILYKFIPNILKDNGLFEWRGFLVDVARHFLGVEKLKSILFNMAMFKFNILHLHLTDSTGWRLEIKKFPEFTQKSKDFFSQNEMIEIIEFASMLGIEIVPEIDVPGHTRALIVAKNTLACDDKKLIPWESEEDWGKYSEASLCISRGHVKSIIKDIYKEVANIFPSKYIHIGGDECPTEPWNECDYCSAKMRKNNWSVYELQENFMNDVINFIEKDLNKISIFWDDIQENSNIISKGIYNFWRSSAINKNSNYLDPVVNSNMKIINNDWNYTYLDSANDTFDYEKEGDFSGGVQIRGIDDIYDFDPFSILKNEKKHNLVIGSEVSMWSERIRSYDEFIERAFPRAIAFAEVLWGKQMKAEEYFISLDKATPLFDILIPQRNKTWKNRVTRKLKVKF